MERSIAAILILLAAACDGDVSTPDDASGSGAGSGASGSGAGGTGAEGNAGTTSATTGGAGGGVSTAAGGASSASGGSSTCSGLFEADCMGTPDCAPVYDDVCCPTCEPKACADCSNLEFHHCDFRDDICDQAPACGTVPDWVCLGGPHVCPQVVGGDTYECEATPGCVVATCSPDVNCNETKCAAVGADSCTAMCDAIPPSCPAGTTAEADGSCYTGFCIPSAVCGTF
ncbi:MAG: hypothetical protein WKG00_31335 [Polyangiaceae bacterium]